MRRVAAIDAVTYPETEKTLPANRQLSPAETAQRKSRRRTYHARRLPGQASPASCSSVPPPLAMRTQLPVAGRRSLQEPSLLIPQASGLLLPLWVPRRCPLAALCGAVAAAAARGAVISAGSQAAECGAA
jgi:hypothetical protein